MASPLKTKGEYNYHLPDWVCKHILSSRKIDDKTDFHTVYLMIVFQRPKAEVSLSRFPVLGEKYVAL